MSSPAKRMRLSTKRTSLSGRTSIGSNAGPSASFRPSVSVMAPSNRKTALQPTYDIITGEPIENDSHQTFPDKPQSRPVSRSGGLPIFSKRTQLQSQQQSASIDSQQHELSLELRARVNSLEYDLRNLQSEKELLALQHEKELREAQSRADADYAKYQVAESERVKAVRHQEALQKEVNEVRTTAINEKTSLERRVRDAQTRLTAVTEEKDDAEGQLGELQRDYERFRTEEVEGKRVALENTLKETREEMEGYRFRFEAVSSRLAEREKESENYEKQIMELKTQVGGGEELEMLKRELGEQVAYVRRLETQAREQSQELRKLRDERKAVSVVEEEKRALEVQVNVLKETEQRFGELEIQKEILEDEKRTWTSLLEVKSTEGEESGDKEFESPEAVVKALVNERIEHALAVDHLGKVESELAGKDEALRALQSENNVLKGEIDKAKASVGTGSQQEIPDSKAFKRLDRQRQLAVKEVEYLRAQLKTFDSEETVMMENNNFDIQRSEQIKQLEGIVDEYKTEIHSLHEQLSQTETNDSSKIQGPRGTKRSAEQDPEDDTASQIGPLLRKNKNLQIALQKVTSQTQQLATELQATKSQLKALRASSKFRILELRDNPTAQAEAIKQSTLRTLREENAALMAQLRGGKDNTTTTTTTNFVPTSSLDALKLDLDAKDLIIADREKRMRRQREIWTEKAAEFRDVIASVLGYRINFLPNGKVKVSSLFYRPARHSGGGGDNGNEEDDDDDDDPENYILFDGENGTMKISGGGGGGEGNGNGNGNEEGRSSSFRTDIRELVEFWVQGKREIPCFLAAMTLEFYERFGSAGAPSEGVGDDGGGGRDGRRG